MRAWIFDVRLELSVVYITCSGVSRRMASGGMAVMHVIVPRRRDVHYGRLVIMAMALEIKRIIHFCHVLRLVFGGWHGWGMFGH